MSAGMRLAPALETGTLTAHATFQDPDLRLVDGVETNPAVRIEEGGVTVLLEFPDRESLRGFLRRVAALHHRDHERSR